MAATRHLYNDGKSALPLCRFFRDTPLNVTSGRANVPPDSPVRVMPLSHSDRAASLSCAHGSLAGYGSGYDCSNVHESTLDASAPDHTWVVTEDSRLLVQNVGVQ